MMKKVLSVIVAVFLTIPCIALCGFHVGAEVKAKSSMTIVATIFPEYDWVLNILGENPANVEVTLLLDNGVNLHSYQPTAGDILKISTCDIFIYVGGESDEWVEDALGEAVNQNMIVINLLEALATR